MTAVIKNELGTITMNEELIASIAGFAAGENYGIVAMNSKTAGDALLQLVGGENVKRGVKVSILEDQSIARQRRLRRRGPRGRGREDAQRLTCRPVSSSSSSRRSLSSAPSSKYSLP